MRVALATDVYLPQLSGIADSVDGLAAELVKAGHDVRIYAPRRPDAEPSATVRRLPALAVPGSGSGLVVVLPFGGMADLRDFRPDVIHAHTFSTVGWLAARAARRLGVALVGTDHTFPADYLHYLRLDFPPLPRLAKRAAAAFYDRCLIVTAPSQSMLDELRASGMTAPARVISNPIRSDLFRPLEHREAIKKRLGIGPEAVLLFGRLAAEKNLDFAVELFGALALRRHAELVLVGDGPHRGALERRLSARGLAARARFLGELHGEALNEAINACDLYLITSKSDTQSMTMLQAEAAGLPVVAIRAGGLPEYVIDGESGFVVDETERDRFVDLMATLLDDRAFARRLGTKGREIALRFAPPAIAGEFVAVYREAIAMAAAAQGAASAPKPR